MRTFKVFASREILYKKIVKANSLEDAEDIAWDDENGWKEIDCGEWMLENQTEEITN
jgi:hypothetical protein